MNIKNLIGRKVVLICPKFYNYSDEIFLELENQGAEVVFIDERPSNSFFFKSLLRLGLKKLLESKIEKYYVKKIESLADDTTDFLIINPEAINEHVIQLIRSMYKEAKFTLYMWDSIKNKKNIDKIFPFFDKCFSFDPDDVKIKSELMFMPLFYKEVDLKKIPEKQYSISFAGSCHSDRLPILRKLEISNRLMTNFYIFSPSYMITLLIYFNNFLNLKVNDLKSINYEKISSDEVNKVMKASHAVIDIHHPKQTGLTMRCFEVLASGVKLITTNTDIKNYDFYNTKNILIIDRDKIDLDEIEFFLSVEFDHSSMDLIKQYRLDNWVRGLVK